ncbi:hypothetical protein MXD61_26860 [Frankia sp. AgPm24]|nr:hypothetical protein [Frankia sp. AgPm24]MCK9925450.1 hypothetical protein [Frankia sp. AgPm24]
MRLSEDERDHLFYLAGHQPQPADGVAHLARAGLIRMLDLLGDTPALVISDLGEVLAQNRAALLVMGDHAGHSGDRRYIAHRWFTDPAARAVCPPEEQENHARQLVADLRAVAGRRSGDPMVTGLVDRLQAASADAETRERLDLLRVLGTQEFPSDRRRPACDPGGRGGSRPGQSMVDFWHADCH